jgi:formate hydrogenlyase subunit 3/multisubunit Na+/H+ antiporter MnhD subunit
MTQTQYLIFFISAIPLVNAFLSRLCFDLPRISNFTNKFLPILFFANLIGLTANLGHDSSYLLIAKTSADLYLGLVADKMSLGFLFLLNFFWLIFVFYSQRFLELIGAKNLSSFKIFFNLIIAFITLIILSKNLLTILFFYNCLILLSHFFAAKFLHKKNTKFSLFFTWLLYLESIFFFLAIVATYKFNGQIEFTASGLVSDRLDFGEYILLIFLYFSGLFLSVLVPFYLLYRNISFDPLIIYTLFFLSYAFSSFYILFKLFGFVFGFHGLSIIMSGLGFGFVEVIFLANIIFASFFLLKNNGLKSSFFYLFFQQLVFALFSIITFAVFNESRIYLALLSFLLSLTLIFLCISNFVLYITRSEGKKFDGLFYDLRITSIFFIFAVMNLTGIVPGIGALEKFFLLKIIVKKKLFIAGGVFLVNFLSLLLFAWKIFYPLFARLEQPRSTSDIELIKNIDFDSGLILTPLIVAVVIFLGLVFFPLIINF